MPVSKHNQQKKLPVFNRRATASHEPENKTPRSPEETGESIFSSAMGVSFIFICIPQAPDDNQNRSGVNQMLHTEKWPMVATNTVVYLRNVTAFHRNDSMVAMTDGEQTSVSRLRKAEFLNKSI
ncbi:MAG: hypothetical protein EA392_13720 [Cryomorphaceae bacterium]|nr:MAG: hypothetical protein EA392_13720 [Cryomorphaceae bacterium]